MRMSIKEDPSLGGTLTYDTKTATLSLFLSRGLPSRYEAAIAIRNRLYVLESVAVSSFRPDVDVRGGLHCLTANLNDDDEMHWAW